MGKRLQSLGVVGLLSLGVLGVVSAGLAAPPPAWRTAIRLPGSAALGSEAGAGTISCPTVGNCAAGGDYRDGSGNVQAFVVDETNGVWGKAMEVPGTATLDSGGSADVQTVSCAAAGKCVAGGFYRDGSGHRQLFVVDEKSGSWGKAIEVPGTAALNTGVSVYGDNVGVGSVSCATAGNCAADGTYIDGSGHIQAFVVDETNGSWGTAIEVPGTAALNSSGVASMSSISCATAGNCTAGGSYFDGSHHMQGFVVDESNGVWGTAIEVPGLAALNTGGNAFVYSVSCATVGNCAVGGVYMDVAGFAAGQWKAFVVGETNGSWGTAIEVPGTAAFNSSGYASLNSISCAAAGNCSAGGSYPDDSGHSQAFVVNEMNGSWSSAIALPGAAALDKGGNALLYSVSCAAAGSCAAGGTYRDGAGHYQAFVANETHDIWGAAIEVPGTATLNTGGYAAVNAVSCATARNCAGSGAYVDGSADTQAFLVTSHSARATLLLTPRTGHAGTRVRVPGANFAPGERVTVRYLTGLSAPRPAAVTICTATAKATGASRARAARSRPGQTPAAQARTRSRPRARPATMPATSSPCPDRSPTRRRFRTLATATPTPRADGRLIDGRIAAVVASPMYAVCVGLDSRRRAVNAGRRLLLPLFRV